jgi:hypothetical protein
MMMIGRHIQVLFCKSVGEGSCDRRVTFRSYKKPHVVLDLAATQEAQTSRILPFFHIVMTHILLCYCINIFPVLRIHIIKVDTVKEWKETAAAPKAKIEKAE